MPKLPATELPRVSQIDDRQVFQRLQAAGCRPQYRALPSGDTALLMHGSPRCQRLYRALTGITSTPAVQVDFKR